jgi:hypothetical protein
VSCGSIRPLPFAACTTTNSRHVHCAHLCEDYRMCLRSAFFSGCEQGYLMKVNYLNHMQTDSVLFGLRRLTEAELLESYGALRVRSCLRNGFASSRWVTGGWCAVAS